MFLDPGYLHDVAYIDCQGIPNFVGVTLVRDRNAQDSRSLRRWYSDPILNNYDCLVGRRPAPIITKT